MPRLCNPASLWLAASQFLPAGQNCVSFMLQGVSLFEAGQHLHLNACRAFNKLKHYTNIWKANAKAQQPGQRLTPAGSCSQAGGWVGCRASAELLFLAIPVSLWPRCRSVVYPIVVVISGTVSLGLQTCCQISQGHIPAPMFHAIF